jgi:hypothetical protein
MTDYICEFCNKEFKSISNLNYHKKTAKYCLDIQSKNNQEIKQDIHECNICKKQFNRNSILQSHLEKCKEKNDLKSNKEEILHLKKLLEEKDILLQRQINELDYKDNLIEKYKKELEQQEIKYQNKIEELDKRYIERITTLEKEIISIHEKYMDKINVNIQNITNNNPTNHSTVVNNKNKLIQNIQPLTNKCIQDQNLKMSIDDIKNHAFSLADFYHNNILKDKLLISDKSRNVLVYKDEFGNINRDEGGIKLCNMIINESRETILKYAIDYLKYLDSQPYTLKTDTQLKLCSLLEKLIFVCQNTNKPNNSKFFQNFKKNFVNRIKEIMKDKDDSIDKNKTDKKSSEKEFSKNNSNQLVDKKEEDYKFKYLNLEEDDEDESEDDIKVEECYIKEDKLEKIIKEEFIIKKSEVLYELLTKYLDFLDIKAEEKGELDDDYYFVVSSLQSLKKINTDKNSTDKKEIEIIKNLYNGKEFIEIYFRGLMNIKLYENELIIKNFLTKNDIYILLNDDLIENKSTLKNETKDVKSHIREEEIDENHYVYKKYKEEYMKTRNQ